MHQGLDKAPIKTAINAAVSIPTTNAIPDRLSTDICIGLTALSRATTCNNRSAKRAPRLLVMGHFILWSLPSRALTSHRLLPAEASRPSQTLLLNAYTNWSHYGVYIPPHVLEGGSLPIAHKCVWPVSVCPRALMLMDILQNQFAQHSVPLVVIGVYCYPFVKRALMDARAIAGLLVCLLCLCHSAEVYYQYAPASEYIQLSDVICCSRTCLLTCLRNCL